MAVRRSPASAKDQLAMTFACGDMTDTFALKDIVLGSWDLGGVTADPTAVTIPSVRATTTTGLQRPIETAFFFALLRGHSVDSRLAAHSPSELGLFTFDRPTWSERGEVDSNHFGIQAGASKELVKARLHVGTAKQSLGLVEPRTPLSL